MPKIEIEDLSVNYVELGDGPHVVLLLPGYLGTIETSFGKVMDQMDKTKFRLVCWDPPGYGKSRPPDRSFEPNFLEEDAKAAGQLMKILGHEKYSVVGWSHGGATGIHLAALFPENVTSLVTLGTRYMFKPTDLPSFEFRADLSLWAEETLEGLLKLYERNYLEELSAGLLRFVRGVIQSGGHYINKSIDKVLCPTLIMNGRIDSSSSYLNAYYLQARIQNSAVHIIPKAGHDAQVTHAEVFVSEVETFLQSPSDVIAGSQK